MNDPSPMPRFRLGPVRWVCDVAEAVGWLAGRIRADVRVCRTGRDRTHPQFDEAEPFDPETWR